MNEPVSADQRRATWTQGVAIGVACIVLYVLSYGPAGWLVWKTGDRGFVRSAVAFVYWPVEETIRRGPDGVSRALWSYVHLWRD
jgi:hypothetical protein